jgi:hypothetical protein
MRVTRDILLTLARENAAKLTAKDRGIACVFITGSLLDKDPFLGGVTDIDLFCIHDRPVNAPREIVRINSDVHLDLAHYQQEDFTPARKLRTEPWLGSVVARGPLVLHDPLHWFDFIRSTGTAQFNTPENIAGRVRAFLSPARLGWQTLVDEALPQGNKRTLALLEVIRNTANAAAVITGAPLPVRRLFLELPERCRQAGLEEVAGSLVQSFTNESVTDDNWEGWLAGWESVYDHLNHIGKAPASLNLTRKNYYLKSIRALAEERPAAALWTLLFTWARLTVDMPKIDPHIKTWQELVKQLTLDNKNIPARLEILDGTLDRVEETLERLRG